MVLTGVVRNDGTGAQHPFTINLHGFISRATVYCSGTKSEGVRHYRRLTKMLLRCMPENTRCNMTAMNGFGLAQSAEAGSDWVTDPLLAGHSVRFVHRPFALDIGNQFRNIPMQLLGAGGLVFKFELADAAAPLNATGDNSTQWHISDVRVQASTITVNSALSEAYSAHVLSGKSLLLPMKTFTCTAQALPDSSDFDVSISRNFTRLCTVFVNFNKAESATDKDVNTFYSPVTSTGEDNFESFLQIGAKRWSDGPRIGSAQHYYHMLGALGYANSIV